MEGALEKNVSQHSDLKSFVAEHAGFKSESELKRSRASCFSISQKIHLNGRALAIRTAWRVAL
jgi:hypothetical protein